MLLRLLSNMYTCMKNYQTMLKNRVFLKNDNTYLYFVTFVTLVLNFSWPQNVYPLMSLFRICLNFYQPRTIYMLIFSCAYKKMSVLIKNMVLYMDSKFVQDHNLYWVMTLNVIHAQIMSPSSFTSLMIIIISFCYAYSCATWHV